MEEEVKPRYRITIVNKSVAERRVKVVEAYCFAEAASRAYLLKNNRNQSLDNGQGWWKIHSVTEVK